MISERHAKILEARGFDIELMERLGIESSSRLGRDCIAIPVMQGGVRINTKYRTIAGEKRFSQEPGARQIFWNVDRISDETLFGQPLISTEGEFDAIAVISGRLRPRRQRPQWRAGKRAGRRPAGRTLQVH